MTLTTIPTTEPGAKVAPEPITLDRSGYRVFAAVRA